MPPSHSRQRNDIDRIDTYTRRWRDAFLDDTNRWVRVLRNLQTLPSRRSACLAIHPKYPYIEGRNIAAFRNVGGA